MAALLIPDEVTTGFRWHNGGAQKVYGIIPDLSAFGKALANGFSVSPSPAGASSCLGGLDHHDRPRVFLLSTTHGAETHTMAAAIATMRVYQHEGVIEHLYRQGTRLKAQAEEVIRRHGLTEFVQILGRPCCLLYSTLDQDGRPSQAFRTLFLQETIRRGVLMPSLVVAIRTRTNTSTSRWRRSMRRSPSIGGRSTTASTVISWADRLRPSTRAPVSLRSLARPAENASDAMARATDSGPLGANQRMIGGFAA